jgi:hypothetical protein
MCPYQTTVDAARAASALPRYQTFGLSAWQPC